MSHIPKRPQGSSALEVFGATVWDWIWGGQGRIIDSPTVKASYTTRGIRLDAVQASAQVGSPLVPCMITQLISTLRGPADLIGVTEWNPVTQQLVGDQFYCAKCITGRQPLAETIDQIVINYTDYLDDVQRKALFTINGVLLTEYHTLHPRYMVYGAEVGDDINQTLILVGTVKNGTGVLGPDNNELTKMEIQPNRYWTWNPSLNGFLPA